jgi:hypothetical protein
MYYLCTKLFVLPTECIYVSRVYLSVQSVCFPEQHSPVYLYSGELICLLVGTI